MLPIKLTFFPIYSESEQGEGGPKIYELLINSLWCIEVWLSRREWLTKKCQLSRHICDQEKIKIKIITNLIYFQQQQQKKHEVVYLYKIKVGTIAAVSSQPP